MPPSSSPRVILVGCGAVARQFYVPALRALQNAGLVRVSIVIDPQVIAREAVARAFPRAAQAPSLDRTTAPEGTLVIIASPPAFHAQQTLMALERGWHVLCESPLATTVTECHAMIAAAQRHQRWLAVGLHRRFFAASAYLRALCRDGLLGSLSSFTIKEGGEFRWPAGPGTFDRAQTPGGVLLDPGVQVLDLLGWWLGDPEEVRYADDAMGGMETNAFVQLTYPGGARGRVHLSRDWATAQRYRFVFERGIVTWTGNDANGLSLQLTGAPAAVSGTLVSPLQEPSPPTEPRSFETSAQCFIHQLCNVLGALAGEEALLAPGETGVLAVRLIEQCYGERRLVTQPWLTAEEAARAGELTAVVPFLS